MLTSTRTVLSAASLLLITANLTAQQALMQNPFLALMTAANVHAKAHGAQTPVLSPVDATLIGPNPSVDVAQLHKAGFKVIPWTTNDPAKMRALIDLRVDGIISDRPDLLQQVVKEEAAAHPDEAAYFKSFDVSAHRGGRGLRPENTLPSFEDGLDHLSTTVETDTGVTTDHVSLIWHDQFLNPESCRRVDGTPYTLENRVYTRDISLAEAQSTFICDKLHPQFPDQKNDLALSPVAVAFAAQEHLISPYVPTHAEQLFRFTRFYAEYYRSGAGKSHPEAAARAANAERVRFNLETKILPLPNDPVGPNPPLANSHAEPASNHTVDPQTFVNTLCGAIVRNHMESRAEVQSFDFRTLILVEEQFPKIPTYYLTESPKMLSSEFVPAALRQ
ncbi:glycerophosphodiester phosphodiesterase family protein [Tunturiibacter gelidoferens]|uniref:Glycerophosphoryl diester phosphodiesterase n=1 Tax=Tunturiibacter gelidiferens TaxID=3069689 RepID=A0ACC5P129_9BACT|nr:glycerophosphodiester phosphodiesterase family protein [Edaphobacter lichenicola]MBB5340528.1 glycerophosphoryl diester phosphodiesterase [Edaphobacter lichenicola]